MNTYMGFRDDYHTTYPVRAELIEALIDYVSSDLFSSVMKALFKVVQVIQHLPIAVSEF